jgi:hypothetical protein
MHNNLGLFLAGTLSILGAPIWLLGALVVGFRRRANWRPQELALIVAVAIGLVLTLVSLR